MRAIIFDMDGVLLDSEPLHDRASKRVFEGLAGGTHEEIQPDLENFRGRTDREFWEHVKTKFNLSDDLPSLVSKKQHHFMGMLGETEIHGFPHMEQVIAKLSESFFIAVASSSSRSTIEAVLDALGVLYLFPVIVSSDDVPYGKPEPDIFLLAADRLGIEPKECIVIEDSLMGVRAGKAAKMRTIAFCPAGKNRAGEEAGEFVQSYAELMERLGKD